MRAVIYLRISQDRTGEEAGVNRQREDCERRCRDRGWEVAEVLADNNASAAGRRKRPGFEAMLRLLERGEAERVVAWHIDRLQRNRRDEVRLYELCQTRGAQISLARGPDLEWETPTGRYLADNLGALARLEIEQKSDRHKRANLQAAQKGRRVGGRRPFGYEQDGATIRPVEAAAVRAGFEAVLAGESLSAIARTWNDRGLRTDQVGYKSGIQSLWRSDSVRAVLRNPRYVALRALNREVIGPAAWPALVAEETFRAVQAVLDDEARRTPPRSDIALLTGIAQCGVCHGPMRGGRTVDKVRVYRCRSAYGHVMRQADPVDRYVTEGVLRRLQRSDAADILMDTTRSAVDVQALRSEAQAIRIRVKDITGDYALGRLTRGVYDAAHARANARLAEIEDSLADAGRLDVLGPLINAGDVEAAWAQLSIARQREAISALLEVRLLPPGRGARGFRPETVQTNWRVS